uniref:Phosphatase-like n=1 Tax=Penaeus monodon TaxID=6687 RepID=R4NHA1_PENMO|nr:phosphatase-like [Penaeus monodon]
MADTELDNKREGLLSIDRKLQNVSGKLPEKSIYDATAPLSFPTSHVESGLRTDRRYLILPVADAVLEIMASERTMASYNWRAVERGGTLDFVRTIVRGSIHDLTGTRRLDVGRPAVGYLALCVLASAMENVSEMYGEPPENPSPEYVQSKVVQVMRYLFGLCVSIMASGTNRALSDAYRIFTRLDSTSSSVSAIEAIEEI